MAKTDGRGRASQSQYVYVENEDIFAEDEKRLAARVSRHHTGWITSHTPTKPSASVTTAPVTARFYQDPARVERDVAKLRRGIKQLKTVPPPPSTTNPQFTYSNILELWNKHRHAGELKSKWVAGLSEEHLGHDVYLNRNDYVEKLEDHRQEITKCFVYNETASHITGIPALRTEQDKQLLKRNGWLQSPASRANNLSQRKVFFNQFTNSVRTFTVENTKKVGFLKSNSESKISCKSNQIPKRALFQSPEKGSSTSSTQPCSNYSIPSASSTASSSSTNSLITPSRSLLNQWIGSRGVESNSSVQGSGGSKARDNSIKRSCSKSLKFEGHQSQPVGDNKLRVLSLAKELSRHHHEKMLWAVQTLLKSEGVVSTDMEYKSLYANIYRETTQIWLKNYENKPRARNSTSGTCDLMVRIAKQILPTVEQKLGLTCADIKAKKEYLKKKLEVVIPKESRIVSSTPINKLEDSKVNEDVFSPEMMGASNLCDDINAVISSLDNLPPDPGDTSFSASHSTPASSTHVLPHDKQLSNSVIKDLLSAPLLNESISPLNLVKDKKEEVLNISTTVIESSVTPQQDEISLLDPQELTQTTSIINTTKTEQLEQVTALINASISEPITTPILAVSNELSAPISDIAPQSGTNEINSILCNTVAEAVAACNENSEASFNLNAPFCREITDPVNDTRQVSSKEAVPESNVKEKAAASSEIVVEPDSSNKTSPRDAIIEENSTPATSNLGNPDEIADIDNEKNKPSSGIKCFVKLRPCPIEDNQIAQAEAAPQDKQKDYSHEHLNGFTRSKRKKHLADESTSPKVTSESSDLRRSKRKRNCDTSSAETTPCTSNKTRSSKRLCADSQISTPQSSDSTDSRRKSSRTRLSFDEEKEEELIAVPLNNSDLTEENKSSSLIDVECKTPENSYSEISVVAESSSAGDKPDGKNIDKENDSSMENISDVDTHNWSPVLKLKRSSTNLWSSELQKKRISSRRRKENTENSPSTSPFLDLEGPFKYRLCKRALPGEFVHAIIKGDIHSAQLKKLVKKSRITKDCVLVRTVQEGLELRIPCSLFNNENVFLGPNKFQNMISDIIEDAVSKMDDNSPNQSFHGFSVHDINRAVSTYCSMERVIKVIEKTGQVVKPLFTMYKYAIVKQTPQNVQDFYQIFVEILRTSLFLKKSNVDQDTIQVRPFKSQSPKKIQLEINIPINLVGNNSKLKDSILRDLTPTHNIISC